MQRASTTHRRGVKFCETRTFDESTPYDNNQTIIDAQQHVAVEVDVWDLTSTVLVRRTVLVRAQAPHCSRPPITAMLARTMKPRSSRAISSEKTRRTGATRRVNGVSPNCACARPMM